jgi:hypothetical protein
VIVIARIAQGGGCTRMGGGVRWERRNRSFWII